MVALIVPKLFTNWTPTQDSGLLVSDLILMLKWILQGKGPFRKLKRETLKESLRESSRKRECKIECKIECKRDCKRDCK